MKDNVLKKLKNNRILITFVIFSSSILLLSYIYLISSISNFDNYPIFYDSEENFNNSILAGAEHLRELQNQNGLFNITDIKFSENDTRIYSHSYIFDALLDIQPLDQKVNNNVIQNAVNYLFQIISNNSCWKFNINIPPDCDDSSLAIIALIKAGNRSEVENSITNLTLAKLGSGHFNTWIYNNSDWEGEEMVLVEPVITATVIYALWLYNFSLYSQIINDGIELLENNQTIEGYWIANYWYIGPFYASFIISRILCVAKPNSSCLEKFFDYLINIQNLDGSWGRNNSGNP
ncbi:MAG: hypothetical protein ACFFDN_40885, partial [Candidatus Hodarchaeota archaeon]